jgi:hypothetical protein
MKDHPQTTIEISVFSARRFYAHAPAPSPEAGALRHTISIPRRGILKIRASSDTPASLLWVDGLAVRADRAHAFVDALRRGEIPKPILGSSFLPASVSVSYHSPARIADSRETLLSVLGLAPDLLHTIASSRQRTCDTCGATIKMYESAAHVAADITESCGKRPIDIQLRAPLELLAEWGELRGFRVQESPDGASFIELESLVLTADTLPRVRKAIESVWMLPSMSVWCVADRSATGYAPAGFCNGCAKLAPPASMRQLAHILKKGASDPSASELLLDAWGTTVAGLMSSSLSALDEHLSGSKILSAELRDTVRSLGLDALPLGRTTDTLSASALARLAVIAATRIDLSRDALVILDVPSGLMLPSETSATEKLIECSSRHHTTVALEQGQESYKTDAEPAARRTEGVSLGTLRLRALDDSTWREATLRKGSLLVIRPSTCLSAKPLARDIFSVISGRLAVDLQEAHFASLHPCEPCSIDAQPFASSDVRLLVQLLGLYDPLAKLYASALEARMQGISPRDFAVSSRTKARYLCPECSGLGITLEPLPNFERPQAHPCTVCLGTRFKAPIKEIEFRGRPMWSILNSTFSRAENVLRALPKVARALALVKLLRLEHLPVGMPIGLLSFSEQRLAAIAAAILSSPKSRPPVIIIEEPLAGLSSQQAEGLTNLMTCHELGEQVTWIVISRDSRVHNLSSLALDL